MCGIISRPHPLIPGAHVLDTLIDAFTGAGAPFMYAITAALAFGLAVLLERIWIFWIAWKLDQTALLATLEAGKLEEAGALSEVHPACRLVRAGMGCSDADSAWNAMGTEAPMVESEIQQRVPYLATVGNLSTMLGLLGTVYGLIIAFSALSDTSALETQTQLNEGIATAMATTAWGLIVGIPALACHSFLEAKAGRLRALCEAAAAQVARHSKGP
jgi:biopolymer transport protein ExbB